MDNTTTTTTTNPRALVDFVENRWRGAFIGKDFPDVLIEEGTAEAIEALVELADDRDESPRRAWRWLREDLTVPEALAWLGVI